MSGTIAASTVRLKPDTTEAVVSMAGSSVPDVSGVSGFSRTVSGIHLFG
jgi:hypothetical protein